MKRVFSCSLVAATALCSLPGHAFVTNGSLTQTNLAGFFLPQNSDLPPDWTIASGTPDVLTPTANAGADYTIPISTPIMLTGTGSDGDGNAVSYC